MELLEKYRAIHRRISEGALRAVLDASVAGSLAVGIPVIPPSVAVFVHLLVRLNRPHRILEVGSGYGYSALLMAAAAPDAHIDTMEMDAERCSQARRWVAEAEIADRVQVFQGEALELLAELTGLYQFAFIDGAKEQYPDYLERVVPLVEPGGAILADDILYDGEAQLTVKPWGAKEEILAGLARYRSAVLEDPALFTTILPLAGGFALSLVLETGKQGARERPTIR